MDPMSQIVLWRCIERLAIVSGGILSLGMGWDLFRKGIIPMQSGEIQAASISVKLHKVGPGIFFALFGAIILVQGFTNKLNADKDIIEIGNVPIEAKKRSGQIQVGYFDGTDRNIMSAVFAINSINELSKETQINEKQIQELKAASKALNSIHHIMLYQQFSKDDIDIYYKNPKELETANKTLYDAIYEFNHRRIK